MVLYRLFSTVDGILWKKGIHFTSFSKEIFSVYFEHKAPVTRIHLSKIFKNINISEILLLSIAPEIFFYFTFQ